MYVVLVRHAGPVTTGTDPGLSAPGEKRALALASLLVDAEIGAIFTSELRRTKETAAPLATQSSLTAAVVDNDPAAAAARVKAAGKRVLVVGHTNTVPEIIEALGGPADVEIGHEEFDRLFVLQVPAHGAASLLSLRYHG